MENELYLISITMLFASLIGACWYITKRKSVTNQWVDSPTIIIAIWCLSGAIISVIEAHRGSLNPDVDINRFLFYIGISAVNILSIGLSVKLHKNAGLKLTQESLLVCLALFVLGLLNIARYIERTYFGTDALLPAYQSVSMINLIVTLYIVGAAFLFKVKKEGV